MSRLPGKTSPQFIRFSERRRELVVCSKVEFWVSHFDPAAGRSRRCGGERCALCHLGMPRILRFVMLSVDDRGCEQLVELRERHREVVERIDATVASGRGVRIAGRKEGAAINSAVTVSILGDEAIMLREIRKLVDCLGLPPNSMPRSFNLRL